LNFGNHRPGNNPRKFARLLEDENADGSDIDQRVCALGRCLPDVTPYLEPLLEEANEKNLLSFIEWSWSALSKVSLLVLFGKKPLIISSG
jgi:hypothetical protein